MVPVSEVLELGCDISPDWLVCGLGDQVRDVLDEQSAWLYAVHEHDRRFEQPELLGAVFTCHRSTRLYSRQTGSQKIHVISRLVVHRIEVQKVCFENPPVGTVQAQRLAGHSTVVQKQNGIEPGLLEAEREASCTSAHGKAAETFGVRLFHDHRSCCGNRDLGGLGRLPRPCLRCHSVVRTSSFVLPPHGRGHRRLPGTATDATRSPPPGPQPDNQSDGGNAAWRSGPTAMPKPRFRPSQATPAELPGELLLLGHKRVTCPRVRTAQSPLAS